MRFQYILNLNATLNYILGSEIKRINPRSWIDATDECFTNANLVLMLPSPSKEAHKRISFPRSMKEINTRAYNIIRCIQPKAVLYPPENEPPPFCSRHSPDWGRGLIFEYGHYLKYKPPPQHVYTKLWSPCIGEGYQFTARAWTFTIHLQSLCWSTTPPLAIYGGRFPERVSKRMAVRWLMC